MASYYLFRQVTVKENKIPETLSVAGKNTLRSHYSQRRSQIDYNSLKAMTSVRSWCVLYVDTRTDAYADSGVWYKRTYLAMNKQDEGER